MARSEWSEWGQEIGEYAGVLRQSTNPHRLSLLNRIPMTPDEAHDLIYQVYRDKLKVHPVEVRFTGKSGRSYWALSGDRIILPKKPLVPGQRWYGSLRKGLVIHELAHVVHRTRGHGRGFVDTLDRLAEDYR